MVTLAQFLEFCEGIEKLSKMHGCDITDLYKTIIVELKQSQVETKKRT